MTQTLLMYGNRAFIEYGLPGGLTIHVSGKTARRLRYHVYRGHEVLSSDVGSFETPGARKKVLERLEERIGKVEGLDERLEEIATNVDAELYDARHTVADYEVEQAKRLAYALTDAGNGERLSDYIEDKAVYVADWGRWAVWDGKRWVRNKTGRVANMAKLVVREMYEEAAKIADPDLRSKLVAWAMNSEADSKIEAMIRRAKSEPGVSVEDPGDVFDRDPWLLNVENGTLDLKNDGKLRPHDPADMITKLVPVDYLEDAKAPVFEQFLVEILPSEEVRRFVQKAVGYALTGDVSEQVMFIPYGTGANGKSTFLGVLLKMLGDYAKEAADDLLVSKQGAHPTELADLFGAWFVASMEVDEGRKLAEARVKQLTGGDRIKARFMRQDFWEFDPTHKFFMSVNHKPVVRGTDHAIWRRIRLVPFTKTFAEEEKDALLPEKLAVELPGILAWAVRGCVNWQSERLGAPKEVMAATEEYKSEMDVLSAFVDERCETGEKFKERSSRLYEAYREWCQETGESAETMRTFGNRMTERGYVAGRGTGNAPVRLGIKLRPKGGRVSI